MRFEMRFEMKRYAKIASVLIAIWFVIVVAAAALHAFTNPAKRVGVSVAIAASAPLILFVLWVRRVSGVPAVCVFIEPAHAHCGADVAADRLRLCSAGGPRNASGRLRVAGRLWRHADRRHGNACGLEAGRPRPYAA